MIFGNLFQEKSINPTNTQLQGFQAPMRTQETLLCSTFTHLCLVVFTRLTQYVRKQLRDPLDLCSSLCVCLQMDKTPLCLTSDWQSILTRCDAPVKHAISFSFAEHTSTSCSNMTALTISLSPLSLVCQVFCHGRFVWDEPDIKQRLHSSQSCPMATAGGYISLAVWAVNTLHSLKHTHCGCITIPSKVYNCMLAGWDSCGKARSKATYTKPHFKSTIGTCCSKCKHVQQ